MGQHTIRKTRQSPYLPFGGRFNVALIEPPEARPAVEPLRSPDAPVPIFAPPWSLLCLRAYLVKRAGHLCNLIDTRLFTHFERDLVRALGRMPNLRVAVINTHSLSLDQTMATMETIKRHFPTVKTILCGQHPSQFPELVQNLPWMDYALCGDPEPVLRNLLARLDGGGSLQNIPGCALAGHPAPEPVWKTDPGILFLFDGEGINWGSYQVDLACRAIMRLTRGSASNGSAPRLAVGEPNQPFRVCPYEQAAETLQEFGNLGVTAVMVADPPGFWSHWEIEAWCEMLLAKDNDQTWGLQLLPTPLTKSAISRLKSAFCRRVDFICPSTDSNVLAEYGCNLSPRKFRETLKQLTAAGITSHLRFWMGGLETNTRRKWDIIRILRDLDYPSFTLEPFPSDLPSAVVEGGYDRANTEGWLIWAKGSGERGTCPESPWKGNVPVPDLMAAITLIGLTIQRSPRRWLRHLLRTIRRTNWIETLDDRIEAVDRGLQRFLRIIETLEKAILSFGLRSKREKLPNKQNRVRRSNPVVLKWFQRNKSPVPPRGIHGWLLLFCVLYAILFPFWFGRLAYLMWIHALHGWFMDGAIKYIAMIENAWLGLASLAGMAMAWAIWRGNPRGKQIAMSYLVFRGIGFIGCYSLLLFIFHDIARPETLTTMNVAWVGQLIREGTFIIVWWMYFRMSKRVKNTYGNALHL